PALGLAGEHVERRAEPPLADRALERLLVDDLRARRVHEKRAGLHRGEHVLINKAARLGGEREVDAEHVGPRSDLSWRDAALDAELARALVGQAAAPGDDGHPERLGSHDHLLTDAP